MNSNATRNKNTQLLWPGGRAALRRLLVIALVLFPCAWVVNAFLIGTWNLLANQSAESYRHRCEAVTIFAVVVAIVFLITLLPQSQRFLAWISSRRVIRRGLIILAWLVTITALFYGEEDWRGHHTWTKYSDGKIAQGAQLDYRAFVPQPIPDADNFAATPEIESWFVRYTNNGTATFSNTMQGDVFAKANTRVSSDASRWPFRLTDLVAWQMAFDSVRTNQAEPPAPFQTDKLDSASRAQAATAVLEALDPLDPGLEELRTVSARPQSLYPVVYDLNDPWGILLPHLGNIKGTCLRLDLRACAELAAGQKDRALDDVKLTLRLGDSLNTEPFLISYLVRLAILHIAVHSVWEGITDHHWTDAQLKELQALLERYDFISDVKRPFDGEHAAGILTADLLANGIFRLNLLFGDPSPTSGTAANAFGRLMPRGWWDLEKLNYSRLYDLQLKDAFDLHNKRVFPHKIDANSKAVDQNFANQTLLTTLFIQHQVLAENLLPALGNVPKRGAVGQAATDQAIIACALERYRLAHGQYPNTLDELAPEFISKLPHDVITGDPYKYRRDKDAFVLYSVGWNETDDGGQVVMKGSSMDPEHGDWVWAVPGKVAAADSSRL